tara:strand:+ start:152 stop:1027 length:876 start_codon:yes stop_codon:yes gene_type:complete
MMAVVMGMGTILLLFLEIAFARQTCPDLFYDNLIAEVGVTAKNDMKLARRKLKDLKLFNRHLKQKYKEEVYLYFDRDLDEFAYTPTDRLIEITLEHKQSKHRERRKVLAAGLMHEYGHHLLYSLLVRKRMLDDVFENPDIFFQHQALQEAFSDLLPIIFYADPKAMHTDIFVQQKDFYRERDYSFPLESKDYKLWRKRILAKGQFNYYVYFKPFIHNFWQAYGERIQAASTQQRVRIYEAVLESFIPFLYSIEARNISDSESVMVRDLLFPKEDNDLLLAIVGAQINAVGF